MRYLQLIYDSDVHGGDKLGPWGKMWEGLLCFAVGNYCFVEKPVKLI